jgi:uncharacterized protein (TIGR03435 family)
MKNWTLLAAVLFSAAGIYGQDLTGTWQGMVHPPDTKDDLRTVIKVSTSEGGTFKGNFYSIDQTVQPFPTTGTIQGTTIKLQIPGIGCVYEGKLSADGNTITGSIKQGFTRSIPWVLKRVLNEDQAWSIAKPPEPMAPMTNPDPAFEVATIKRSDPDARGRGARIQGRTLTASNMSLADLVTFAYDVHVRQVLGAPGWFESEHFDFTAKPEDPGQPSPEQMKIMLRKLLADRFQLSFHRDKKEIAVYTLSQAKSGAKISKGDSKSDMPAFIFRSPGSLIATNANMQDFAKLLQGSVVDRPVMDQTGLTARYEFSFEWTPTQLQSPAPTPVAALGDKTELFPDLFTAMQQQLGLKLEATKLMIDVLIVDRMEKPSDN